MMRSGDNRGFTLLETLVATSLAGIVMLGLLSATLFLGRNLTRLANYTSLEAQSRRTIAFLKRDAERIRNITAASDTGFTATLADGTTVTYAYDSGSGDLSRNGRALLTEATVFDFNYFDLNNLPLAATSDPYNQSAIPETMNIRQVQARFTLAVGVASSGARASVTVASSRLLLRGKQAQLQN